MSHTVALPRRGASLSLYAVYVLASTTPAFPSFGVAGPAGVAQGYAAISLAGKAMDPFMEGPTNVIPNFGRL